MKSDLHSITYRPEIDGIRALAVGSVIMFHAGIGLFGGGFVGVDIFFVISGFLITRIIITDLQAGRFSLLAFYERRARRILPALLVVLLFSTACAWPLLDEASLASFSSSLIASALFYSNLHFIKSTNYFDIASELKPLLHTWSLSVEEQFYILYPALMIALFRYLRNYTVAIILSMALASLLISRYALTIDPAAAFFQLYSRWWQLSAGALAAFAQDRCSRLELPGRQIASLSGAALVLLPVFLYDNQMAYPGFNAIVPVTGAVALLLFATTDTFIGKALSFRPLVMVGLMSYSLYLWHQPLFSFARHAHGDPAPLATTGIIAAIVALSYLTWRFIELPARNPMQVTRARFVPVCLATAAVLVCGGVLGAQTFSKSSPFGPEAKLAKDLIAHGLVFHRTSDDRLLNKHRIFYETASPDIVVVGSSRTMQVGNHIAPRQTLNFSTSGATLQERIALAHLALEKFRPKVILFGADPWLLNDKAGSGRNSPLWRDFESAMARARGTDAVDAATKPSAPPTPPYVLQLAASLFRQINSSGSRLPADDAPELEAKLRRDGSLVYGSEYIKKSATRKPGLKKVLSYHNMDAYSRSNSAELALRDFVNFHRTRTRFVLVLTPYHPLVYNEMKNSKSAFIDVEENLRSIAHDLGIEVVGSFDPEASRCEPADFYDGMHPKDPCMQRVIGALAWPTGP